MFDLSDFITDNVRIKDGELYLFLFIFAFLFYIYCIFLFWT